MRTEETMDAFLNLSFRRGQLVVVELVDLVFVESGHFP